LVANDFWDAKRAARSDWTTMLPELRREGMSRTLASRLATEWTRAGELEHASIAAFARFTLELLTLGAPAELVADATRAMADELEHARLCFALASRYLGRSVRPSTLDVSGSVEDVSLSSAVTSAVVDGCIEKTLASIESTEAAEHALDPVIQSAHLRIAEDEGRHSALAWRFVRWALGQGDATLARLVEETFERAAGEFQGPATAVDGPKAADDAALIGSGVLSQRMRTALRSSAFTEVVEPCARALLERAALDRKFEPVTPLRRTLE
jgi:hypothetical protein